ncbi:hypothetical protein F5Y15DRAFT_410705 [Xylariaceae sp. FL0016]|nr:hypothetical protein F5Y15DRAFT_410705 [Xylariaceae sp. FL0016]
MAWTCGSCERVFGSERAREQHMDALGHVADSFECDTCTRCFGSSGAARQHMNVCNHFGHECYICDETWPTREDREAHEAEEHFYCADCDRTFQNYNNIKMHLNSRTHRGLNLACPFCNTGYTSATGLSHHLEGGNCPRAPTLDRDEVFKLVRRKDPTGIISKNLIGYEGSTKYESTRRSWNGSAYECYLCHRGFKQLQSLNQHLASPTHQEALYHCPKRNSCGREFTSLAALMNHLESETCGYTRFENVQRSIQSVIGSGRRITL